jgi:hypothetical protein
MSERAAQRRAAWETVAGLSGVLAANQIGGDSMPATIAATVGVCESGPSPRATADCDHS